MVLIPSSREQLVPDTLDQVFLSQIENIFKLRDNQAQYIYEWLKDNIHFFLSQITENINFSEKNIERITQAYLLSTIAHSPIGVIKEKNATRNNNKTPYIQHPKRLSIIINHIMCLLEDNIDEETLMQNITIMLLHDTDEDTLTQIRDINNIFWCEIINKWVNEMTLVDEDIIKEQLKNMWVRKILTQMIPQIQKQIYYSKMSIETQIYKMIDRLECFATMESMPIEKVEKQIEETISAMQSWSSNSNIHKILWVSMIYMINQVIEYRWINRRLLDIDSTITDIEQVDASKIKNYIWDLSRKALVSKRISNTWDVESLEGIELWKEAHPFKHYKEEYNVQALNII